MGREEWGRETERGTCIGATSRGRGRETVVGVRRETNKGRQMEELVWNGKERERERKRKE